MPLRGFSLIEMLVVLAIIAVVTSIALVGQTNFNRSVILTDTAYTVALSLREMQSLGLSSRTFGAGAQAVRNPGYGAHFSRGTLGSYLLFADVARTQGVPSNCNAGTPPAYDAKPGNCLYDQGQDGVVRTTTFERGYRIDYFCGKNGSTRYCSDSGTRITDLDIGFLRSDTDTVINGKLESTGNWIQLATAEVRIEAPDNGGARSVCISSVGQISVSVDPCP